eukprot:TRINITY_DN8365_c0_g1_i1.p2 TRINITY_DN8365_c0_g1~~TRINITY_DN8365_c0_g1_i1.p2  ORF type:complete len:104 (-),score=2.19 TRINITY_DN8365_c0_g1_i1:396-707(-)
MTYKHGAQVCQMGCKKAFPCFFFPCLIRNPFPCHSAKHIVVSSPQLPTPLEYDGIERRRKSLDYVCVYLLSSSSVVIYSEPNDNGKRHNIILSHQQFQKLGDG